MLKTSIFAMLFKAGRTVCAARFASGESSVDLLVDGPTGQDGIPNPGGRDILCGQGWSFAVGSQGLGGYWTDAHADRALRNGAKRIQKEENPAGTGKYQVVTLLNLREQRGAVPIWGPEGVEGDVLGMGVFCKSAI